MLIMPKKKSRSPPVHWFRVWNRFTISSTASISPASITIWAKVCRQKLQGYCIWLFSSTFMEWRYNFNVFILTSLYDHLPGVPLPQIQPDPHKNAQPYPLNEEHLPCLMQGGFAGIEADGGIQ